ncbi:peptidoglycan editing factor PgeF [Naumannella sp. ID2617S]|nr:peptidoglycan editing factor PgeF [Naumannella sp. ID2617S]
MFTHLQRADPATGGVGVAFTDRHGGVSAGTMGSLNLGRTNVDDPAAVTENFELVRRELGLRAVLTVSQVHGTAVHRVDAAQVAGWSPASPLGSHGGRERLPVADAMVSSEPGVALCIRVADCLPVLFADAAAGVIGAAHAGRVGLAAGVLPETVTALAALGANRLTAWIGPHICGECYEVPAQMQAEVGAVLPGASCRTASGTPGLDLGAAAEHQLRELGCRVHRLDPCTRTDESLHSHRRDQADAGRLGGLIWLADQRTERADERTPRA